MIDISVFYVCAYTILAVTEGWERKTQNTTDVIHVLRTEIESGKNFFYHKLLEAVVWFIPVDGASVNKYRVLLFGVTAAKKPHDAQFSESSAIWSRERLSMEKKEGSARKNCCQTLVVRDAHAPVQVLYGKEIFLSRPGSIKSRCAYLRSTRIFCPRVFAFDGKYQLMRVEKICTKTLIKFWDCAIFH